MLGTTQRPRRIRSLAVAVAAATVFTGAAVAATGGVAMATATNAGLLTFTGASTGTSATTFTLTPPSGAACTGNTAYDGTRVQAFIAPVDVELMTLTFGFSGPLTTGVYPLYSSTGTPFINQNTGNPQVGIAPIAGAGVLTGLPTFTLAPLTVTQLPAGTYRVGYACTTNSGATLDKYWFTYLNLDGSTNYTKPTTPLAGSAPEVVTYTGGAVTVTWSTPPSGGLPVYAYELDYSADAGSSWHTAGSWSDLELTKTVTGLSAATSYQFRVKGINGLGVGAPSATVSQTTPAISAPGAVTGVVATPQANGTSIALTWTAPADTGGAAISNYVLWYGSGASWRLATAATAATTLTGLAKNTNYTIIVAASNGTFYSPVQISAIASATTVATVPGTAGKPALTKGFRSITLKWTAPADNGGRAITAYRVQRSLNGITWTTVTSAASASTRTYVATGLTSGKRYYFRVAAINPVGVGAYSAAANALAG